MSLLKEFPLCLLSPQESKMREEVLKNTYILLLLKISQGLVLFLDEGGEGERTFFEQEMM